MSEPTKGPWATRRALAPTDGAYDWSIGAEINGQDRCIAEVFGRASEDIYPPAEANARFIVAACNTIQSAAEKLGVEPMVLVDRIAKYGEGGGLATLISDMALLLSCIETMEEATGESLGVEDAALVRQIRAALAQLRGSR